MNDYKEDKKDPAIEAAKQRSQQIAQFVKENRAAPNKGVGGHIRDTALSALSGAVSVPEMVVGLADIPTGGRVGKFLENEGGGLGFRPAQAKEAIAGAKTERSQEQMRDFQETKGFGAKFGQAIDNPSLITNTVVESLPAMGAGGVIGRGLGLAAKGLSPVAAGALGEGAVGAGLAAEQIRQQTDDGLLTGKQAGLAAATGATTAGFGFAGGKVAQKLGIGDVDTMIAGGTRSASGRAATEGAEAVNQKNVVRRVLEGAASEGVLEELPQSISETVLQNIALNKPIDEGVDDAAVLGLLSGAAMGGFAGGITRNRQPVSDDITPTEDMGQEAPRLGLPNPNRPGGGNQLGYQGEVGSPNNPSWLEDANPDYFNRGQGPDASRMRNLNPDPELPYNGELGGQFSAAPDGTVYTEAEYNDFLAQQQAQARANRDAGMSDINDVTPVPEGYEQSGSDPRLPAPRSDFEVTPDGTVQTPADANTMLQNERAANAERLASRLRGDLRDNTPVPTDARGFGDFESTDNRTPSQKMGLDPNAGALSAAAVIAVDSGASSVTDQTSAPTQSAWQQAMSQRLQMADETSPEYQSLAQAMANEPTSVPAKNKMLRDAAKLPSRQTDSKVVNPKARVIDEAKAKTVAYTPKGDEVQAQWDVVDASQLVTSNTDTFTPNPDFPAERQPRDRTRAGSQKQVNDIANKLQPNMLGASSDISTGSPFVGANDNVVDSGNGRTMAIRRAYQEGGEKAKEYRQFVSESAGKYGLDANAVNQMQAPVLVRRNLSNMDRNQFASEANQTAVARMSSTEQAATDAKKLPDASLLSFGSDGAMNLYQSSGYVKNFIASLPNTEQSSMMDDSGALSQEGKRRVEAAIIQDAYDAPNLVTAISETLGEGSKNILKVVTDKAPQISQINNDVKNGDAYENALSKDIADAAQAYIDITKSGQDVESYLSQDALFDDGLSDGAKDVLKMFYDNRRSAKAMGENIQERINQITGRGNPKQGGFSFDDVPATTSQEVNTNAKNVDNKSQLSTAITNRGDAAAESGTQEISTASGFDTRSAQSIKTERASTTNQPEANQTADNAGAPTTETGVSDRNAPEDVSERSEQTGVGFDTLSVDQEIDVRKSYVQIQTEVADEMGITTNEDGEYDISDAQFDVMEGRVRERMEAQENQTQTQSNVSESETVADSPVKPPQSPVVKTETVPETKKPATKKADKPATEIEDFGEKIVGARKDMGSFYQKEITDDDISNQPLSKIWPKKDIDAIENKQTAALATVLRGTIPSKPRKGYKLNNWVAQVKNARGIMQQILSDDTLVDQFIEQMTKVKGLQTTGYHAQLLSALEQDQWARVTAVDHRPYYAIQNDDGSTSPDMSFDVTIDKRRHVIPTENKQISEVVDKVNELLSGEVKAPTLKFDLYSRGRGDKRSYFITQASDKDKTALIEFNDRDAARAFLRDNNNELSELWNQHKEKVNVKKTDTRSRQNRERIGPDHRSGQDVTTEQFMEAFGLRGGQFGNWVKQGANSKERQGMLNDAYDAFMDLAGVLNIPPEAIGLGGKLGMSFGARGKGAAMAHYEPSQVVINLTKTKGAGTLAHEWFHALDHHFTSFRDSPARNKEREDTYITYKPEPSMMYTPQKGRGYLISKPALEKRRAKSDDPMYNAENWAPDPNHPAGVRPKVEEAFADLVNTLNDSPMKERANTIDKGATDGYWSRIIELAARAFESYVINKLDKQGARSDFLANVTPEDAFPRNMDRYPYLLESEMAPVAEAFDNLFATIDSKPSEDGNGKTLFSRAGQMKQTIDNVKANATGSTSTTRQQVINKLSNKFGKETINNLIADGKLDIKMLSDFVKNGRLTIPSDVDGLYLNGKATLIADNLSDEMIIPTFLHELGGHGGMQTLMNKQAYNALMKDFDALVKAGDPLAVKAKAIADKVARSKQEALDEYLPYLLTLASRQQVRQGKVAGMINRMVMAVRAFLRDMLGVSIKINSQDILSLAERMVNEVEKQNSAFDTMNAIPQFSDPKNPDMRFSRAAGMTDQFDPKSIAKESMTRFYDWVSSAPPGKLSWWHKTIGTMYNLAQRNPYFKPVFESTEKFINDVSFYASKASELAPRLLPQLDSIRDITKSAIGAKDNEALSKPIFEGTLLWGRDLDGKAVLIEDWRKKVMAASKQDRLQMLKDANRITPAQLQELATLNNIQANRFINGIIDDEVNAGLVWTDNELRSKFDLNDEQIGLYREFRAATDNSLDSLTRSDMLRRLGKDAADIEQQVMEAGTLREAVFAIEQHIKQLITDTPKKEKTLKQTLKDIKESQFRTNELMDNGYAPLSRFGQYTVDVVDADGNREYFGMFESAYEARKMEAEMKALYDGDGYEVSRGALSNEEFKLFAGVTPETAELFGEMLGLDATGDKAADDAFQEYLRRTKNNRSAMKRLMHRKGIKGYSEDVGRVLASFIYSNARHTSAALNMGNLDRSIQDIPKGEGQLKDAAVKLAQYIKNPQEEGQLIRGWMFAQYLGGSIASAIVNITQPIAVSFPYLSQFGGGVKAAAELSRSSSDWAKSLKNRNNDHFEADLREAIERAEANGTLSPQEVHNLLKQASGKNPLQAGDGTKYGDGKAAIQNTFSRISLGWGTLFSLAEQVNRRVTFVAAYRMAKEQGMADPADFATKSIKETQFVYNKASRMNWGRGAVGGTLMTFKTYTVSYMELMHRLWTQGEKGSQERAQGRKAAMLMMGTLFMLGGAGGLPFMEDIEDVIDGAGQIMGYNFSTRKSRQDFLDAWLGEIAGDFIESGISSIPGSPTDVSGRLGMDNLIPGTGIFKERTDNTRDALELLGPAGDFSARMLGGSREILKGVANVDGRQIRNGALEMSPVAIRNAAKGAGMLVSGTYKDTKGYKVSDVTPIDAVFKGIGFQPKSVSKIQQANYLGQSSTSYYNLRASDIRALWAAGVSEGNQAKVADARAAVADWNKKNPEQPIVIKPNDIARRVREMNMDKSDRVVKLAPKSMRGQMAQDFAQVREGL